MLQSKAAEKKGTPLYHLARALDNMLSQAGLGGLATWIEENPPCRMLSPTEYRYEVKGLPPFENHIVEVWQRWCVGDTATGKRRFEVPATTGEHSRPLLVAFTDEYYLSSGACRSVLGISFLVCFPASPAWLVRPSDHIQLV